MPEKASRSLNFVQQCNLCHYYLSCDMEERRTEEYREEKYDLLEMMQSCLVKDKKTIACGGRLDE